MKRINNLQKILIIMVLGILTGYIIYFFNNDNSVRKETQQSVSLSDSGSGQNNNTTCSRALVGFKYCSEQNEEYGYKICQESLKWEQQQGGCTGTSFGLCISSQNQDDFKCHDGIPFICKINYEFIFERSSECEPSTESITNPNPNPPPGSNNGGGQTGTETDPGIGEGNDNSSKTSSPPGSTPSAPLSTFPNVTCTYFTNYVNPVTGKKGPKRCKPNAFGEVMVCEETQRPRADGSGGDGVCVEKKTSVGETCRFNVQCGIEENYAVGLPFEYELRNIQMRCEKRNSPDGTATPKGFCLPSFRQPLETDPATNPIGCGFNGETDAERDAYCVQQFAVYTQIREGVVGSDHQDPFVSLKVPQNAYCHKIRDAAGNEDRARFECRLKRKTGSNCNESWGNACL